MTRYAVIESMLRREIRLFRGCYEIVKETEKFVFIRIPKKEESDEEKTEKIGFGKVLFITTQDVTPLLNEANKKVGAAYEAHEKYAGQVLKETYQKARDAEI